MLIACLLVLVLPMLAGAGGMSLLRWRRAEGPVDNGPWKMMATLATVPTLLMVAALIWMSMIPIDHAEFRSGVSLRARLMNALPLIAFLMPGVYIGAAITGAVNGVNRQRAYLLVFGLLAPVLIVVWYLLALALGCVTTDQCL